nr:MAG TPA: hypothetical protein [Caudoviricetes sp.]
MSWISPLRDIIMLTHLSFNPLFYSSSISLNHNYSIYL